MVQQSRFRQLAWATVVGFVLAQMPSNASDVWAVVETVTAP